VLFVYRCVPARGAADELGRQPVDADLLPGPSGSCRITTSWGVAKAGASKPACVISRSISAATISGSTRSLRARSTPSPPRGIGRFPLYPQMEPAQFAIAAQRSRFEDCRQRRGLSVERSVIRGHRRSASRRLRVSRRRHEARRRPRYFGGVSWERVISKIVSSPPRKRGVQGGRQSNSRLLDFPLSAGMTAG